MSDRLLELAVKAGVATRTAHGFSDDECGDPSCGDCYDARPRLDIAHDLLATLPDNVRGLAWSGFHEWLSWTAGDIDATRGTFEECVVALAERATK